jgi:TRAP-type uncharacterized transport system substrate-binding protein
MVTTPEKSIKPVHLEFFSPAPAGNPMHSMDVAVVKLLNRYHSRISASWRSVPLPDQIPLIDQFPDERKKHSLPIVSSVDFMPARSGEGPSWHRYERPFKDLKFVATTSVIGFGISTFDETINTSDQLAGKTIAVIPRPSTLRVLSEAVLRDAWGIYDQVTLKESFYPEARKALLAGEVNATFWNSAWEIESGFQCLDPGILQERQAHWIGMSLKNVKDVNKKNPWGLHRMLVPAGAITAKGPKLDPTKEVGLAGLSIAICAWDSTENELVYELVRFLDEVASLWQDYTSGCHLSLARMARFPGINDKLVHSGALGYYNENRIAPGDPVQLSFMQES